METATEKGQTMKVTTYNLTARNGRHIRKATQVELADGTAIRFMEKMSKREAIAAAVAR